jgi:hypothetical protein
MVSQVMSDISRNQNLAESDKVFRFFPDAVGEEALAHCRIRDLEKDLLVIEVDHPAWIQQMGFQKRSILAYYHEKVPKVPLADIRFILGKAVEKPASRSDKPKVDLPEPPANRSLDEILGSLGKLVEERNREDH